MIKSFVKSLFVIPILFCFFSSVDAKDSFKEVPVSYQGRILPAGSYAKQWIYSLSHSQDGKAIDKLWQLQFFGYGSLAHTPLFWVQSKNKQLFDLPLNKNRFSYEEIKSALNQDKVRSNVLRQLILYHYSKTFFSEENRARRTLLELNALAPGLLIDWQGSKLQIHSAPNFYPWEDFQPNTSIAEHISLPALEEALKSDLIANESERILGEIFRFEKLQGPHLPLEESIENDYLHLRSNRLSSKEIALLLEQKYPLMDRLKSSGEIFKVLPGKSKQGEWYPLSALHVKSYNSATGRLELSKNFTIYPDELFDKIREVYFVLEKSYLNGKPDDILKNQLANLLIEGYEKLANIPYTTAIGKKLYYPSFSKIYLEAFYSEYPLTPLCTIGYVFTLSFFSLSIYLKRQGLFSAAFFLLVVTFSLHTFILLIRSYILGRPPVSNMHETMLYVPWVAVLISLFLRIFYSTPYLLLASASASLIMLLLMQMSFYSNSFENVQAVLDSQYWLLIHVLMVVGSYGLFLLASLLGHFYLIGISYSKKETNSLRLLSDCLLQSLYFGLAFLVTGTLLGGMWAAESWGRFWDWDPKESWAFISICVYLLWIHAFRFGRIHRFGIAGGAIIGFLSISFTWYGVNYILGTGLHSYGFGSGGTNYYYSFLVTEVLFLIAMKLSYNFRKDIVKKTTNC